MKYNINHESKIIFFWTPKSGVMSLVRLMYFLKFNGEVLAEDLKRMTNKDLYSSYRTEVLELKNDNTDYTNFKKVFFGRNPYHRIISCYIDKYVHPFSATPDDVPETNTYGEFLDLLRDTGLTRKGMKGKVDFGHFCSVKDDIGWQFYKELGSPKFDLISLLPPTALPEGDLTHHFDNVRSVFELLDIKDQYEQVSELYENHDFSHDSYIDNEDPIPVNYGLTDFSREELWDEMKPENTWTVPYRSFYPAKSDQLFREIYSEEFDFYEKRGISFSLNA